MVGLGSKVVRCLFVSNMWKLAATQKGYQNSLGFILNYRSIKI